MSGNSRGRRCWPSTIFPTPPSPSSSISAPGSGTHPSKCSARHAFLRSTTDPTSSAWRRTATTGSVSSPRGRRRCSLATNMSLSSPAQVVDFLAGAGQGPLRSFIVQQRWFAAKSRALRTVDIEDWAVLDADRPVLLLLVRLDGERYYLPVAVCPASGTAARDMIARIENLAIADAHEDLGFVRSLLSAMASHRELTGRRGSFVCRSRGRQGAAARLEATPRVAVRISGEQSNTSVVVDRSLIVKSIRRPQLGINPDVEVLDFLASRTRFPNVPPLVGWIEYLDAHGHGATVAVLQGFIENTGDGWRYVMSGLEELCSMLEGAGDHPVAKPHEDPIAMLGGPLIRDANALGVVTGGLHAALASDPHSPAFSPEPVTYEDVGRWCAQIARELEGSPSTPWRG